MTYISLDECLSGLNWDSAEPLALMRDKVTGWHLTVFKGHQASVEEICAEVNLLDPNDEDLKKISEVFHYSIDAVVKRERASYEEALRNLKGISRNIKKYNITNQSLLYDIALKAAQRDGLEVTDCIQDYGIEDEEKRYQIALRALAQNVVKVSLDIGKYRILSEERRYQLALKAAALDCWGLFSWFIRSYNIQDEEKLYNIAAEAAAVCGGRISEHIQKYGIKSEKLRFRIALIAVTQNGDEASRYIENYDIKDEELRYQIALKAAETTSGVSRHIKKYNIKDEKKRFQIAAVTAARSGGEVSAHIKDYEIQDEELLYQIALKAAAQNGPIVSDHIKSYGIKDKVELFHIALKAILQVEVRPTNIINYGFDSQLTFNLTLFAKSLIDPAESHRDAFLSLIREWRGEDFPAFLVAEHPDPFVQMKLRKWVMELLPLELTNEQIEQQRPLFTQLMQLRNPVLRSQITAYLPDADKKEETIPLKVPKKDYSQLARLLHVGLQPNTLTYFYSKLEDPLDQELYLLFLLKVRAVPLDAFLRQPNRKAMLHHMRTAIDIVSFGHPELLGGDLDKQLENLFLSELKGLNVPNFKEAYDRTLNKFRKKELIFSYLSTLREDIKPYFKDFVEFILNGTFSDKRYDVPHLKMIFEKFPIEEEWRKGERDLLLETKEEKAQIPISLADMKAKIITDKHLTIPENSPLYRCLMGEEREKCLKEATDAIQIKCLQLLDPALTEENKMKCLTALDLLSHGTQFQNDVKGWQALMAPVTSRGDYLVSDTDDPNHLFLLGEEVMGSCQKITGGNPNLNKGLVGYLLNGYNRAVVVTDKSGAIVARCLIRLYWDGEKPVLYQERLYARSRDPKLKSLVDAMCLRRAKALNVPLVSAEGSDPYPKALEITGGRVDIEYIDAIGGVQTSKHTVPVSYIK